MDIKFFDSLFEGDSCNGVKLGMGLTGGDFWPRVAGCQNLYRGGSIRTVDFSDVLLVTDAEQGPVSFVPLNAHEAGEVCFYVLRRANGCGYEERTLGAAVKAAFDNDGDLIASGCNRVFGVFVEQVGGFKYRLVWYYCPIDQGATLDHFDVYSDGGSGEIDYETVVAAVDYIGAGFYSYESDLSAGESMLFSIRAVSTDGSSDGFAGEIEIQVSDLAPQDVRILRVKAV